MQQKPQEPQEPQEPKAPEIKHLGKTLPEGRTEDEDTKDTLVSPSLPEVMPDPTEDELLSNLTDEELLDMFKPESLKKGLTEINNIKEQDLKDVVESLKTLMKKQMNSEKKTPEEHQQSTPEAKK
ncbi:hypothetical protein [Mycoplasmopsis opalescens]|uniref:hypothetical protein n=1 Tax=Mycoplasmopsis opalescens TaxID=114886 RepID=UPI0012EC0B5E|nr:hypothetical protein [Mycoplasmopsis opalescens]